CCRHGAPPVRLCVCRAGNLARRHALTVQVVVSRDMMKTIIVRYAEIALKGENRRDFERKLAKNIQRTLGLPRNRVQIQRDQILLHIEPERIEEAKAGLRKVFGVAWFAEVARTANDLNAIRETVYEVAGHLLGPQTSFALRTRRSNKHLPFTSRDINLQVGADLQQRTGAPVDLTTPDVEIHIAVKSRNTFIYAARIDGPGGLPVGTNGRVLSLLSGGFDSIASSYLLAKRGARVDYLHFHVFPGKEGVLNTKMPDLWSHLSRYTLSQRVYLANYTPFQMAALDLPMALQRHELVTFRRLMVRVGERLAEQYGYDGLVLGDSLGQVASQTMENISAVDRAVEIPVFRPLIGMDKVEIVNLVSSIGLEEVAAASYKDCCSIIARHPSTRANLEKIRDVEQWIDAGRVVEAIASSVEGVPAYEGRSEDARERASRRFIVDMP